jgi:hypothetical protein
MYMPVQQRKGENPSCSNSQIIDLARAKVKRKFSLFPMG